MKGIIKATLLMYDKAHEPVLHGQTLQICNYDFCWGSVVHSEGKQSYTCMTHAATLASRDLIVISLFSAATVLCRKWSTCDRDLFAIADDATTAQTHTASNCS